MEANDHIQRRMKKTSSVTTGSVKWTAKEGDHIIEAMKHAERSWGVWLLYSVVLILPICIGVWAGYKSWGYEMKTSLKGRKDYIVEAVPFFFLFIILEVIVDKYTRRKYYRLNDSLNSLLQGSCQLIFGLFIKAFTVIPYAYIFENYAIHRFDEGSWVSWILMFFAVDFGYYWFHRFGHEINVFWASHIAHHSSDEYNLTTALRQGAWQPICSWMFYLPYAFFFPVPLFVFHVQWNTIYQFWIHTRYINRMPYLFELIFNTPSHHRAHHGKNKIYIDKNYGGTLIIFDKIFGTFEPETIDAVYGITHPQNTWDPIVIQFHHLYETYLAARKTPGLFNKLRVFVDRGPGYNYEVLYPEEAKNPPVLTPQTQLKYDSTMPNIPMSVYGFLHSTFILLHTLLIADIYPKVSVSLSLVHSLLFFFGVFCVGALFDQKLWAKAAETVRLVCTLAFVTIQYSLPRVNNDWRLLPHDTYFAVAMVFVTVSWVYLMMFYRLPKQKSQ